MLSSGQVIHRNADSVLLQGAQVSSDSVCGGAGNPFIDDKALSTSIMDNGELAEYMLLNVEKEETDKDHIVVAVAIFGDPTHVANITYDRGTSVHNGVSETSPATDLLELQYS